jgi:hypothetical protein
MSSLISIGSGFCSGVFLGGVANLVGELIATSNELGKFFSPASQTVGIVGGGALFVHFLDDSPFYRAMKIGAIATTLLLGAYEAYSCLGKQKDLPAKEKLFNHCVAWLVAGGIVATVATIAVGPSTAIILGGTIVHLFPFQYEK